MYVTETNKHYSGLFCSVIAYYALLWLIMHYYGLLCIIMAYYALLWLIMHYYGLLCIIMAALIRAA